MNKFVSSDHVENFRIIVFKDENDDFYGFSIHGEIGPNKFEMTPIIFHSAKCNSFESAMSKAKSLIYCLLDNDINYRDLTFGRETVK